jgi:hypothetical protein
VTATLSKVSIPSSWKLIFQSPVLNGTISGGGNVHECEDEYTSVDPEEYGGQPDLLAGQLESSGSAVRIVPQE